MDLDLPSKREAARLARQKANDAKSTQSYYDRAVVRTEKLRERTRGSEEDKNKAVANSADGQRLTRAAARAERKEHKELLEKAVAAKSDYVEQQKQITAPQLSGDGVTSNSHGATVKRKLVIQPSSSSNHSGSQEGTWRAFTDCDGNHFDVLIRNFVAAT